MDIPDKCCATCDHWTRDTAIGLTGNIELGSGECIFNEGPRDSAGHLCRMKTLDLALCSKWRPRRKNDQL